MLTPALPGTRDDIPQAFAALLEDMGGDAFARQAIAHGLNGAWHAWLERQPAGKARDDLLPALKNAGFRDAVLCIAQRDALFEIDAAFEKRGVAYLAFKGADARERFYAEPAWRAANDIDLLVDPRQWSAALVLLAGAGFVPGAAHPTPFDHETTLRRGPVTIDLHRDLVRPGRMRGAVTRDILARRQRRTGYWGPSDTDTVTIMLVHTAFVRYVTNLSLGGVVDFEAAGRAAGVDWDAILQQVRSAGVSGAAWATATWYASLLGSRWSAPAEFLARLVPGRLRARYLHGWLVRDLPARLFALPLAVPLAFTMALHDTPFDAARAASSIARARLARFRRPRSQEEAYAA